MALSYKDTSISPASFNHTDFIAAIANWLSARYVRNFILITENQNNFWTAQKLLNYSEIELFCVVFRHWQ
jgi:hypothetical protein